MKTPGFILTCIASLAVAAASAARADGVTIAHSEPLDRLSIERAGATSALGRVSMRFEAMGRSFDLDLEPNTALLSAQARATLADQLLVLRGRLRDSGDSWARIVLADGKPGGLIFDGRELYAIETAASPAARPFMFRLADMVIEPGTMSCGVGSGGPLSGSQLYDELVAELEPQIARAEGAVQEIEIGAVSDAGFTNSQTDARRAIMTRLNNVDGIYSNELGIQVVVPVIDVFDDASDPFSDTTDSDVLVDELADYRFSNPEQRQLGLTHLFTARSFGTNTVGIAYIDVLCNGRFGAGLTVANRGVTTDSLIAAHEIGHNFGADHDGDSEGACPDEPSNRFIMAPRVNGNPEFSPCSKSIMLANANDAACIVPLPIVDVTVTSVDQPDSVLLGNMINLNFAVDNRGSVAAASVSLDITLPTIVTLAGASATQGVCTSGASSVSCDLGSIAASSGVTVALTARSDETGTASFTAQVDADADDSPANNQDTHSVEIEPAVNLVVSAPASVDVVLNQNASAAISIENTSILEATAVSASIVLDDGVTANSASWTAGSCVIGDAAVECSAGSFSALSSSTLTLDVLGVTSGIRGYTVTMTSNEVDSNDADNVASGSFNVAAAASTGNTSSREGGGGPMSPLLLVLVWTLVFVRRRVFRRLRKLSG